MRLADRRQVVGFGVKDRRDLPVVGQGDDRAEDLRKPPGATAYAVAIVTVISIFIGYIAARTAALIARGQLLPPRAAPEKLTTKVPQNGSMVPAAPATER